jgi:CheY-like chemotaxis protein
MNGVVGMTELLLGTDLNSEQLEYAQVIRNSGKSLLVLINAILDYSKIEAGKLEIEEREFNLRNVLDDVLDLLSVPAYNKGLEMVSIVQPDLPVELVGDAGRLRQILINLVGNAVKFTLKGEVVLSEVLKKETDESVELLFTVKDTGIGIPDDKKDLVFRSFSQVDGSFTRKYEGSGLGLVISKQLSELLGGTAGFTSRYGHGSEFWCTTVFKKQSCEQQKTVWLSSDVRKKKILVCIQKEATRHSVHKLLAAMDCRFEEVKDFQSALVISEKNRKVGKTFYTMISDLNITEFEKHYYDALAHHQSVFKGMKVILLKYPEPYSPVSSKISEIELKFVSMPVKIRSLAECLSSFYEDSKEGNAFTENSVKPQKIIRNEQDIRILIVEDNPTNQMVASKYLAKLGISSVTANNGREGVQMLNTQNFDMVLMDVQMPVMNGLEATRLIRGSDSPNRNVPIIAMTAHAMKDDRKKCLEAGMDGYISKPVNFDVLSGAISNILKADIRNNRN